MFEGRGKAISSNPRAEENVTATRIDPSGGVFDSMASRSLADTPPEFLHLDRFATLVYYLVGDPTLVECVMTRAAARLESMHLDASDALMTYKQARRTLIEEAMAALNRCEDLPRRARSGKALRPARVSRARIAPETGSETTFPR